MNFMDAIFGALGGAAVPAIQALTGHGEDAKDSFTGAAIAGTTAATIATLGSAAPVAAGADASLIGADTAADTTALGTAGTDLADIASTTAPEAEAAGAGGEAAATAPGDISANASAESSLASTPGDISDAVPTEATQVAPTTSDTAATSGTTATDTTTSASDSSVASDVKAVASNPVSKALKAANTAKSNYDKITQPEQQAATKVQANEFTPQPTAAPKTKMITPQLTTPTLGLGKQYNAIFGPAPTQAALKDAFGPNYVPPQWSGGLGTPSQEQLQNAFGSNYVPPTASDRSLKKAVEPATRSIKDFLTQVYHGAA